MRSWLLLLLALVVLLGVLAATRDVPTGGFEPLGAAVHESLRR